MENVIPVLSKNPQTCIKMYLCELMRKGGDMALAVTMKRWMSKKPNTEVTTHLSI